MKKYLIIAAIILFVILLAGMWWYVKGGKVETETDAYAELARRHTVAVLIPGVEENPVRQELNRILSEALVKEMGDDERLSLAEAGIEQLKASEAQVDNIGTLGEEVEKALADLKDSPLWPYALGQSEFFALSEKRLEIASDIRGLSYRANYHIAAIFERIIRDGGALTDSHKKDLNALIPQIEEQFDRRTTLYAELHELDQKLGL